jgi:hypothetical protein
MTTYNSTAADNSKLILGSTTVSMLVDVTSTSGPGSDRVFESAGHHVGRDGTANGLASTLSSSTR